MLRHKKGAEEKVPLVKEGLWEAVTGMGRGGRRTDIGVSEVKTGDGQRQDKRVGCDEARGLTELAEEAGKPGQLWRKLALSAPFPFLSFWNTSIPQPWVTLWFQGSVSSIFQTYLPLQLPCAE